MTPSLPVDGRRGRGGDRDPPEHRSPGGGLRAWLVDLAVGGLAGGLAGGVVAVNVVIYSGIEGGYEASLVEVFRQSVAVGILTVAILLVGPVLGVIGARGIRRCRAPRRGEQERYDDE